MRILLGAVLCASIALAGCQTVDDYAFAGYSARPLDKNSIEASSVILTELRRVRVENGNKSIVADACFQNVSEAPANCAAQRNEAVSILMMASSNLCLKHRQTIYGREAAANVTFGTLTNFFAGAAAVVNSDSAKTLYAALALFSNSERSLINETIYKQMIVTAVDKKIVESYESKMAAIDLKMGEGYAQYGINQAIRDISTLHNSCSFMSGLRLALEEGTKGTNFNKIAVLRTNLVAIEVDRKRYCVSENSRNQDQACINAIKRANAATERLAFLESLTD